MKHNQKNLTRRDYLKQTASAAVSIGMPYLWIPRLATAGTHQWAPINPSKPIKIGIMYSLSGIEGLTSLAGYKMALMAIEDINKAGGIHGAMLNPIIKDPKSEWPNYTRLAKSLNDENVNITWGCTFSAGRKAALPTIARGGGLLYYGTLYEGRECSQHMIATGSCPNQQMEVGVPWMLERYGSKTYIAGSNYIFSRTMSKQANRSLILNGGESLGDEFIKLGVTDPAAFKPLVEDIIKMKPDWILSNLVGGSIPGFLRAYKAAGLSPDQIPIMHIAMLESTIKTLDPELCAGHYTSTTYFQNIDSPTNKEFVNRYKEFARSRPEWESDDVTLTSIGEGGYMNAMACKEAMLKANSAHPDAIREASRGLIFNSGSGDKVKIDPDNLHTWLYPRIGRVNDQGEFDVVYKSPTWVRPQVFNKEIDPNRTCENGGEFYIKGKKVPGPRVTREIVPQ
jgi:urea transport system substrate-binding protein